MTATGDPTILVPRAGRFCSTVEESRSEYDLAIVGREPAPGFHRGERFAHHPDMRPDVAFRVISRILWAGAHGPDPLEVSIQSVPVNPPSRRLRNLKGELARHWNGSAPGRSRLGSIGRSIQCVIESATVCRNSCRTYL